MFAANREEVIPKEKATIRTQKVMLTTLFKDVNLIVLNALASGARFSQEYFIPNILSNIVEARVRISLRIREREFFGHMDNSLSHNGRNVTGEFDNLKVNRIGHPLSHQIWLRATIGYLKS
jgi:hypothetical protein